MLATRAPATTRKCARRRTSIGKGAAIGAVAGGVLGHQVDQRRRHSPPGRASSAASWATRSSAAPTATTSPTSIARAADVAGYRRGDRRLRRALRVSRPASTWRACPTIRAGACCVGPRHEPGRHGDAIRRRQLDPNRYRRLSLLHPPTAPRGAVFTCAGRCPSVHASSRRVFRIPHHEVGALARLEHAAVRRRPSAAAACT